MFKVCNLCRTQAGLKKRVCPRCKVPVLWRAPTEAEQKARADHDHRMNELLCELIQEAEAERNRAA